MLDGPNREFRRSIVVLHAAETGIGGVNSMIVGLGADQIARFGRGSVHVLVPSNHVADYDGTALVAHVFRRRSRGLRACLAFTLNFMQVVLAHRPTFIYLHSSFAGLTGRLALLCLRPVHRPIVIYCAHGWAFTMVTSEWRKQVFAFVERLLAPLSRAIVTVSDADHRAALQAGLPPGRLHCIPNGTPRAVAEPGASPYLAHPDRLNLLFVGRLDRQKGIDLLFSTMMEVPDLPVHLTVVGGAVVEADGIRRLPNATYVAWLRRQDLAPYYAYADAVVIPSRWEAFGLVAAEAFSFGTPVIASRVGGLAALVEDGVSGFLFDRASPEAFRAILSGLDRDRLRGMRAAAVRRWEQVADLEVMNRRYAELMRSLAAEARRETAGDPAGDIPERRPNPDGLT